MPGQKKIEMESETYYECEREKRVERGSRTERCECAAERAEISCKCAHRSPHATCNLRFAFMLPLLRMCASVLAAACGPQMLLTALQRSRKYEIRLADIRTTANI